MRALPTIAALTAAAALAWQDFHLRVTVNLVQVDATVTDNRGQSVAGLQAPDFRVLLDGKPQEIKYCTFQRASDPARPAPGAAPSNPLAEPAGKPPMPQANIQRTDIRRTIVIFVGDLLTSSESIPAIRAGIRKFVMEQVRPGDLAAIVRASAGLGALQDFTSDKGMLLAAADAVRFTTDAAGTGLASAYEQAGQPGLQGMSGLDLAQLDKIDAAERGTLATTGALQQVIRRMADLPGRKSVVLISDGLRLSSPDEMNPFDGSSDHGTGSFLSPIYNSMRRAVDESVRAGVVIYAVDTRGLASLNPTASDRLQQDGESSAGGMNPNTMMRPRRDAYADNQWGGIFLTAQTGGFMVTESNRIDAALDRVMADQRGYYLLAFQPAAGAMEPDPSGAPAYHKLKVEVLRPGLTIRSHSGFFGVGDDARDSRATPLVDLAKAIQSPFPATDIHLSADAAWLAGKSEYFIRATVYIDGKDVVFTGPPIHRTGTVRMVVRAFDTAGKSSGGGIDEGRRIDVDEDGYRRALEYGLVYTTLVPVPKPGPYEVRIACMDEATGKIGTAAEFVAIPPAKGSGVHLSGVIFRHDVGTDDHVVPADVPNAYSAGQNVRFSVQVDWGGTSAKAKAWQMRTRLYLRGHEAWHSAAMPFSAGAANLVNGSLQVPAGLAPGEYLVRVDLEGNDGTAAAWQWAKLRLR